MVVFMYGTLKFSHLVSKHNPAVSSYFIDDGMQGESLNLNERKYRIAFTVESYLEPIEQKRDPKYVKYLFRLYGRKNGQEFERHVSYHNCTDADYEEFYPVKK